MLDVKNETWKVDMNEIFETWKKNTYKNNAIHID